MSRNRSCFLVGFEAWAWVEIPRNMVQSPHASEPQLANDKHVPSALQPPSEERLQDRSCALTCPPPSPNLPPSGCGMHGAGRTQICSQFSPRFLHPLAPSPKCTLSTPFAPPSASRTHMDPPSSHPKDSVGICPTRPAIPPRGRAPSLPCVRSFTGKRTRAGVGQEAHRHDAGASNVARLAPANSSSQQEKNLSKV